jgi:hypothetical protein
VGETLVSTNQVTVDDPAPTRMGEWRGPGRGELPVQRDKVSLEAEMASSYRPTSVGHAVAPELVTVLTPRFMANADVLT